MMMTQQTNIWGSSVIVKCRPCLYQIYIFGCSDLKDYAYKFSWDKPSFKRDRCMHVRMFILINIFL